MDEQKIVQELVKIQEAVKYMSKDIGEIEADIKELKTSVVDFDRKLVTHAVKCPLNKPEVERLVKDIIESKQEKQLVMYGKILGLIATAIGIYHAIIELA